MTAVKTKEKYSYMYTSNKKFGHHI